VVFVCVCVCVCVFWVKRSKVRKCFIEDEKVRLLGPRFLFSFVGMNA